MDEAEEGLEKEAPEGPFPAVGDSGEMGLPTYFGLLPRSALSGEGADEFKFKDRPLREGRVTEGVVVVGGEDAWWDWTERAMLKVRYG